jgi:hypothetical protein
MTTTTTTKPTNKLLANPKSKKAIVKLATAFKSVREIALETYRVCLDVWCPGWTKKRPNVDQTDAMEAALLDALAAEGCERKTVRHYLYGCWEELVLKVPHASRRPMSLNKRKEMLGLVETKGMKPEEAKAEIVRRDRVKPTAEPTRKLVSSLSFSFRPPNRGEKAEVYLAVFQAALNKFLVENQINAQVAINFVGKKKAKTAKVEQTSWVAR